MQLLALAEPIDPQNTRIQRNAKTFKLTREWTPGFYLFFVTTQLLMSWESILWSVFKSVLRSDCDRTSASKTDYQHGSKNGEKKMKPSYNAKVHDMCLNLNWPKHTKKGFRSANNPPLTNPSRTTRLDHRREGLKQLLLVNLPLLLGKTPGFWRTIMGQMPK